MNFASVTPVRIEAELFGAMIVPITQVIAVFAEHELFYGEFGPGEYVIGRDSSAHIRINAGNISRVHARLTLRYSDWVIDDLGSANGTWVGGERIAKPMLIFPRQDVRLGNVQLFVRRLEMTVGSGDVRAPQSEAVLRFLPVELRDDRRYEIRRLIAKGGMGAVLEAYDAALRRRVAMKVLLDVDSPEHIARFVEEAQVTAQLGHPNIVPVYDINVNERENPFFTMRLLDGFTLWPVLAAMRRGDAGKIAKFSLEELLRILGKVCDALSFAHSRGVVHRDLKPENIMVGEFGDVLVIDWGLAKPVGMDANVVPVEDGKRSIVTSVRKDAGEEFATGDQVIGTPYYMSPEQVSADRHGIDARTDVYALGGLLYHMLTLRPPGEGTDLFAILENIARGRIAPIDTGATPPHWEDVASCERLAAVAMKALALNQHDRHASVREFQVEMRRAFGRSPTGELPPTTR